LSGESQATLAAYGIGKRPTDAFGRRCLLARRMCEAGVRFIQVNYGDNTANPAWDQHSNLPKHADHAAAVDQPIAALLQDLKQRGLLDDTIVLWTTEFGRLPSSQGGRGRDHNPFAFTNWLCGGGIRGGVSVGPSDELGYKPLDRRNPTQVYDIHATLLHLFGLDPTQVSFERPVGTSSLIDGQDAKIVWDILQRDDRQS
jgi:arylsulfatase A-like enzyme